MDSSGSSENSVILSGTLCDKARKMLEKKEKKKEKKKTIDARKSKKANIGRPWTDGETTALGDRMQAYPVVWNPEHVMYKSRGRQVQAKKAIADSLNEQFHTEVFTGRYTMYVWMNEVNYSALF